MCDPTAVLTVYLFAAFCTSVIAWRAPGRPAPGPWLVIGGIVLGLFWPVTLFMHAYFDMDGRRQRWPAA